MTLTFSKTLRGHRRTTHPILHLSIARGRPGLPLPTPSIIGFYIKTFTIKPKLGLFTQHSTQLSHHHFFFIEIKVKTEAVWKVKKVLSFKKKERCSAFRWWISGKERINVQLEGTPSAPPSDKGAESRTNHSRTQEADRQKRDVWKKNTGS